MSLQLQHKDCLNRHSVCCAEEANILVCSWFRYSGMWLCVIWGVVPHMSKECGAFRTPGPFTQQSVTCQKPWLCRNTTVKTSNLTRSCTISSQCVRSNRLPTHDNTNSWYTAHSI